MWFTMEMSDAGYHIIRLFVGWLREICSYNFVNIKSVTTEDISRCFYLLQTSNICMLLIAYIYFWNGLIGDNKVSQWILFVNWPVLINNQFCLLSVCRNIDCRKPSRIDILAQMSRYVIPLRGGANCHMIWWSCEFSISQINGVTRRPTRMEFKLKDLFIICP